MSPLSMNNRTQDGFILATVLLFLVVLSLSAFLAAGLTRTDVQVVNNLQSEKKAFAIAEAGIHEAIYRMSLAMGDQATVSGVNGGSAFNASLAPVLPDRPVPVTTPATTVYGIDSTNTTKVTQIILTTSAPVTGTNRNVTPSLQQSSTRLLYSTTASDSDGSAVDLASTANLTIGWDLCTNDTDPGCSAGANTIRKLPLSFPRPVAKIVSTGQYGNARRKITALVVDCLPSSTSGPGSLVSLGKGCGFPNGGISMNGNTSITTVGSVYVNAGVTSSPPSSCTAAATGGAQSNITSTTGDIRVVGAANGNFSPDATTGVNPVVDPFANLLPPCFTNYSPPGGCNSDFDGDGNLDTPIPQNNTTNPSLPSNCNGSEAIPKTCTVDGNVTLQPGIYYGGLSITGTATLSSGMYIIAGGGFTFATGNTAVTSTGAGGVTIYNTQDPNPQTSSTASQYGAFSFGTGNATASLVASTSGPYQGIALFQDRNNTIALDLQGGNSGSYSIDGAVYAPNAAATLQGHTNGTINASFIVQAIEMIGGSNITVGQPTTSTNIPTCDTTGYAVLGWRDF
jgi:Tfp pilus assembly protein PilX